MAPLKPHQHDWMDVVTKISENMNITYWLLSLYAISLLLVLVRAVKQYRTSSSDDSNLPLPPQSEKSPFSFSPILEATAIHPPPPYIGADVEAPPSPTVPFPFINSGYVAARSPDDSGLVETEPRYPWRQSSYPFSQTSSTNPIVRDHIDVFPETDTIGSGFWRRRVLEFRAPTFVAEPEEISPEDNNNINVTFDVDVVEESRFP